MKKAMTFLLVLCLLIPTPHANALFRDFKFSSTFYYSNGLLTLAWNDNINPAPPYKVTYKYMNSSFQANIWYGDNHDP